MDHTRPGDTSGNQPRLSRHLRAFDPLADRALKLQADLDGSDFPQATTAQQIEALLALIDLRVAIDRFVHAVRAVR